MNPDLLPGGFQGEAQTRRRGLLRSSQRSKQHDESRSALGSHRQPAQLRIARTLRPGQQGVEGTRTQRLFDGPQRISPPRRAYYRQPVKGHARGGERRGVRQVRWRQPSHALAGGGQPGDRRQDQLQFTDAFRARENFAQRPGRPATTGQFPVKVCKTSGDGRRARRGRCAAPKVLPLEEAFEGHHG